MKPHTKAAAVTAFKWATGLSAGFILGPIVMGIASGTVVLGKIFAEKLIVGIFWFPILFFGFWAWSAQTKKNPVSGAAIDSEKVQTESPARLGKVGSVVASKSPSKWNYVGVGAGAFMFSFFFLPQIISGTLANQYYLGAAFWIGVFIYSSLNILRTRK